MGYDCAEVKGGCRQCCASQNSNGTVKGLKIKPVDYSFVRKLMKS
jgi:hypothetical protein